MGCPQEALVDWRTNIIDLSLLCVFRISFSVAGGGRQHCRDPNQCRDFAARGCIDEPCVSPGNPTQLNAFAWLRMSFDLGIIGVLAF